MPSLLHRREFAQVAAAAGGAMLLGHRVGCSADRQVSWLAEIQTPPAALPPAAPPRLSNLLVDESGRPIQTLDGWMARRQELRRLWREFLGSLGMDQQHRPELQVIEEEQTGGVVRQRVEYEIEPELRTQAYLLRPAASGPPRPGVVVFHSTVNHSILQPAGLGNDNEKAFGWKLAQRGCVAFCPRNFLWPDNHGIAANEETSRFQQRHPGVTGMAKMLYDAVVATNILAGLPGVDPQRLGSMGHSLGAKEVLYLAAFDERIKVTVSSEGGIGTRFSNWEAPWYLGSAIKEPGFPREHHELLAMVAPRPFLLVGGESADGDQGWPFIEAALPVYRLYGGTPRVGQYNHRQGHAVPPVCEQRIYEWLETYL